MPRIRIGVPDELLKVAAARAEQLGKDLDELYAEAIERYIDANKNASGGSSRSRFSISRSSPQIIIEIPEALFQRADRVAKRLGKQRHIMYADALAKHLAAAGAPAESALDQGHDLPSGAWRPGRTDSNERRAS
jgi:metal-responsive CopG/Arc/MetJ family transcriptional regulator